MADTRHYTDAALRTFAEKLNDGEKTLVVGGVLPADKFKDLTPPLRGSDVARLIEIVEAME